MLAKKLKNKHVKNAPVYTGIKEVIEDDIDGEVAPYNYKVEVYLDKQKGGHSQALKFIITMTLNNKPDAQTQIHQLQLRLNQPTTQLRENYTITSFLSLSANKQHNFHPNTTLHLLYISASQKNKQYLSETLKYTH